MGGGEGSGPHCHGELPVPRNKRERVSYARLRVNIGAAYFSGGTLPPDIYKGWQRVWLRETTDMWGGFYLLG